MKGIDYGPEVLAARYRLGWSQQRLADESGTTVANVDAVESGGGGDLAPIARALLLRPLLVDPRLGSLLDLLRPVLAQVQDDAMPIVYGELLAVAGRAARGEEPGGEPTGSHVVQVLAEQADVDQNNS